MARKISFKTYLGEIRKQLQFANLSLDTEVALAAQLFHYGESVENAILKMRECGKVLSTMKGSK